MIKCVIWDIDNTLLDGTYLESGQQPPPGDPALAGVVRELASRYAGEVPALTVTRPSLEDVYLTMIGAPQ